MAEQNFKEEDWGDGHTFLGRNCAKKFPGVVKRNRITKLMMIIITVIIKLIKKRMK